MNNTKTGFYNISDEMRKRLEGLNDSAESKIRKFTQEEELALIEYYDKKNKVQLAEFFGISYTTLKRKYKQLKLKHGR